MSSERRTTASRAALVCWMLFLFASALGCGPSAQYRRGNEAAQAGDWYTAVRMFREALADDPDDDEVRDRLVWAEESLVASTTSAAATYVGVHDFVSALQTLAPALELMPHEPRLLASLENVRIAGVTYYRQLIAQGHYRAAVDGATRLGASFPHDREVAGVVEDARRAYAEELRARAVQAENESRLGAAIAWWTALWSLNGSEGAPSRVASLRHAIEDEIRFTYHVRLEGDWPIGATVGVRDGLAEVVLDREAAMIAVTAALSPPELVESYASRIASQPYLAGYREVPNPAYESALRDVSRQEQEVLWAERRVLDEEQDVHRAEVRRDDYAGEDDYQSYYDDWDSEIRQLQSAREALHRERERLQDERERLLRTPRTIEQEVWQDHRYEVEDWQLEAIADFSVQIVSGGALIHQTRDTLSAVTTDQVHRAQPTIGLPADPLIYPLEPVDLAVSIHDQALAALDAMLADQFRRYRSELEAAGLSAARTAPEQAGELLVRYVLLRPSSISPDVAAWLYEQYGLTDARLMASLRPSSVLQSPAARPALDEL